MLQAPCLHIVPVLRYTGVTGATYVRYAHRSSLGHAHVYWLEAVEERGVCTLQRSSLDYHASPDRLASLAARFYEVERLVRAAAASNHARLYMEDGRPVANGDRYAVHFIPLDCQPRDLPNGWVDRVPAIWMEEAWWAVRDTYDADGRTWTRWAFPLSTCMLSEAPAQTWVGNRVSDGVDVSLSIYRPTAPRSLSGEDLPPGYTLPEDADTVRGHPIIHKMPASGMVYTYPMVGTAGSPEMPNVEFRPVEAENDPPVASTEPALVEATNEKNVRRDRGSLFGGFSFGGSGAAVSPGSGLFRKAAPPAEAAPTATEAEPARWLPSTEVRLRRVSLRDGRRIIAKLRTDGWRFVGPDLQDIGPIPEALLAEQDAILRAAYNDDE